MVGGDGCLWSGGTIVGGVYRGKIYYGVFMGFRSLKMNIMIYNAPKNERQGNITDIMQVMVGMGVVGVWV